MPSRSTSSTKYKERLCRRLSYFIDFKLLTTVLSFNKIMSNRKQLEKFNLQFVKETMQTWTDCSKIYERESYRVYSRLRSYLTLYQYRLSDKEKHDIREMLSQSLDDIDNINLIEDMDNYLDGFCFKFDKSIIIPFEPLAAEMKPKLTHPNEMVEDDKPITQQDVTNYENFDSTDTTDQTGIDYYTLQFMQ